MNEDYVSYELALKLKEYGFCEPCDHYYTKEDAPEETAWIVPTTYGEDFNAKNNKWFKCSAPTLAHAQKWLREKKKIDVLVYNCACGYLWEVSKATNGTGLILFDEKGDDENSGCWTSYETALSAGIASALELIEQENK